MKKKIKNNRIIFTSIFILVFILILSSCNNHKVGNESEPQITSHLNDSIFMQVFFNEKSENVETVIIRNKNSKTEFIYGFFDDGITPVSTKKMINKQLSGLSLTYYPNGELCSKGSFVSGKEEGWQITLSEIGDTTYKAYYEKGERTKIEIESSQFRVPEIIEIKE